MINKKNVKDNLLDHSDAKVTLLGEYLKRYLSIISNDGFTQKIRMYDLFCGPGEFEGGGEGSPLVILNQVNEVYNNIISTKYNKNPKINCYFNDIDGGKVNALKFAVDKKFPLKSFGEVNFTTEDYKVRVEKLKNLLPTLRNEKAFIFIDPYGYKEIKAEQIRSLVESNNKAEVLLWLPTQHMYRFAENGTPEALSNLIEELTKYRQWKKSDSVWNFIKQLKEGFQGYLGDNVFVDNFSIKKDENTVFCLFFFTSHIKGFEKMLEAKWEIDIEQGRGWEYSGNEPSLFFDCKTNELEEKLKVYLKSGKKYNGDVYEFTLRQCYLPKHAFEILESWQNKGLLAVFLEDGSLARKKSFYIKYHKPADLDIKKVYFTLK